MDHKINWLAVVMIAVGIIGLTLLIGSKFIPPKIGDVMEIRNQNPFDKSGIAKRVVLETREGYVRYMSYYLDGSTHEGSMKVTDWNMIK